MQAYNDRPPVVDVAQVNAIAMGETSSQEEKEASKIPQPEISIIVDGNTITKPGMKSVFIEDDETVVIRSEDRIQRSSYCSCDSVEICTCNTVCTCESVLVREICTCENVNTCPGNCICNPVCTCQSDCSCDSHCTCNSQCTCQSRSTGCSCAPVH